MKAIELGNALQQLGCSVMSCGCLCIIMAFLLLLLGSCAMAMA